MSEFIGASHTGPPLDGIEDHFRKNGVKAGKCIKVNGIVVWKDYLMIDDTPRVTLETWADDRAGSPSSIKVLL